MRKPEHVRCENCCYWTRMVEGHVAGWCHLRPPSPVSPVSCDDGDKWEFTFVVSTTFCGSFRAEWPKER